MQIGFKLYLVLTVKFCKADSHVLLLAHKKKAYFLTDRISLTFNVLLIKNPT